MNKSRISETLGGKVSQHTVRSESEIHALFRSKIRLPEQLPSALCLKVAESRSDQESAFKLIYESYFEEGLTTSSFIKMRISKYHAVPTTTILGMYFDGKMIGTLSIIQDSSIGLPMDSLFDISGIRAQSAHIAEISSLAIHPDFRGKNELLFPLMKYCLLYCFYYAGIETMVITVNPGHQEFYKALYFFKPITHARTSHYSFVKGAPAVGLSLNRDLHFNKTFEIYSGLPPHKNMFHFVWERKHPELLLPEHPFHQRLDNKINDEHLLFYLKHEKHLLPKLASSEQGAIFEMYRSFLSEQEQLRLGPRFPRHTRRKQFRFPVCLKAYLESKDLGIHVPALVMEVSNQGCKIVTEAPLTTPLIGQVQISVNFYLSFQTKITGHVVWQTENRLFGIKRIRAKNPMWNYLMDHLESSTHESPGYRSPQDKLP